MLRWPTARELAAAVATASILLLFGWACGLIPLSGEVPYQHSAESEEYYLPIAVPFWIIGFLNHNEGLVLGVATAAIAIFTWQLRASTEKLWDAGEKQRSAFEASEARQASDTRILQRAYLAVKPDGIRTNSKGEYIAYIIIENVGRLPARKVAWNLKRVAGSTDRKWKAPLNPIGDYPGDNVLPPGTPMRIGSSFVEIVDLWDDHFLYVWGHVNYEDGFGAPRFTNFCHRYAWGARKLIPDGGGMWSISVDDARYHDSGNDAD